MPRSWSTDNGPSPAPEVDMYPDEDEDAGNSIFRLICLISKLHMCQSTYTGSCIFKLVYLTSKLHFITKCLYFK